MFMCKQRFYRPTVAFDWQHKYSDVIKCFSCCTAAHCFYFIFICLHTYLTRIFTILVYSWVLPVSIKI